MDDNNNGSKNETESMSSIWLRRLLCLFCAIFFFIWEYYFKVFYLKAKLWLPFSLPF